MDGNDYPAGSMPPTSREDALIHIAIRLGGLEKAFSGAVTHEKLTNILNDHRRELGTTVRDSEAHIRGMIESADTRADKRSQDLQSAQDKRIGEWFQSLDRMIGEKVVGAVKTAIEERDKAEAKAREQVENKAKDAVRGFRLVMAGKNAIIGGGLVLVGLFVLKMTFGWSPFG